MRRLGLPLLCFSLLAAYSNAQSAAEHWVVTWTAAPGPYIAAMLRPPEPDFVDVRTQGIFNNQTIRMIVRTSIGGRQVRIRLSNIYGKTPLRIGTAHVALFPVDLDEPEGAPIVSGTDHTLLFGGMRSVTIPAGQSVLSDPADLLIPPLASVAVSLYVPETTPAATIHYPGRLAGVVSGAGDFSGQEAIYGARFGTHAWVSSVDVLAPPDAGAVVVVSDETSGVVSYPAWPARLAMRMLSNPTTSHVAVVTQADSSGRFSFVDSGRGVAALERFERDVFGQSGVQWIVLTPYLPEIFYSTRPSNPSKGVSVDDLAKIFGEIVERAHSRGIKVIGCTVMPTSLPKNGEEPRLAVNRMIRTAGVFDALIDLDKISTDPRHRESLRSAFDAARLADDIDLSLFTPLAPR